MLGITSRSQSAMSDNLVLELLRAIRADLGQLSADVREVKHRLTSLELSMAGMRRDIAGLYEQGAASNLRSDTLEDRVQRIERRLELIP